MEKYYNINELIENKEYDLLLKLFKQNYDKTKDSFYLTKMSDIYKLQNKNKLALKLLSDSYKKSPDLNLAKKLALTYFHDGNFKEAVKYYQKVIDFEGINSNNLYDLACSYHYDGNFKEAYKYYINALSVDSNNLKAINNLGCLYYETKNYKDAFETFEASINFVKNNPEAYYYLGILYRDFLDDLELSILYLKKAIWYDPKHLETYLELIKTYKKSNNEEEISSIKNTVKEMFPNYKF